MKAANIMKNYKSVCHCDFGTVNGHVLHIVVNYRAYLVAKFNCSIIKHVSDGNVGLFCSAILVDMV